MRVRTRFAIAFATVLSWATTALGAGIFFQTVPTTATAICSAPCFQVRMFAQDDSEGGTRIIQAIQFDVDVVNASPAGITDVVVANLPVPPATNGNAAGPNFNAEDVDGNIVVIPFELSASVGRSPHAGQDVLVVHASAFPRSVASLKAAVAGGVGCTAATDCSTQPRALNANRIYLGRFNLSGVTADTAFIYSNATGLGDLVTGMDDLSGPNADGSFSSIAQGSGGCHLGSATGCLADRPLQGVSTAEPASLLLVGAAWLGLGLFRRRARNA